MPRPKGLPKTGGRKPGSVNGVTMRRALEQIEAVKVTVDRVLSEYAHIAFLDIGDVFDGEGNLKPIKQMPEAVRRALAGIEIADLNVDRDGKGAVGKLHKIKLLDKTKALDSIGKHLGMFIERVHSEVTLVSSRETLAKELDERRRARLSAGTQAG